MNGSSYSNRGQNLDATDEAELEADMKFNGNCIAEWFSSLQRQTSFQQSHKDINIKNKPTAPLLNSDIEPAEPSKYGRSCFFTTYLLCNVFDWLLRSKLAKNVTKYHGHRFKKIKFRFYCILKHTVAVHMVSLYKYQSVSTRSIIQGVTKKKNLKCGALAPFFCDLQWSPSAGNERVTGEDS